MRTIFTSLLLSLSASAFALNAPRLPPEATLGDKLADQVPAQISVGLKIDDEAGLQQLIIDQTDPKSANYHQWLTPSTFADRFGLSVEDYEHVAHWMEAAGFQVIRSPNRTYLKGIGQVQHVKKLLGIEPHSVYQWGKKFRTYVGTPVMPPEIDARVQSIGGLDTRHKWRHSTAAKSRIVDATSGSGYAFGAPDFRAFYDFASYFTANATAGTVETAVIATQASESGNSLTPPTQSLIQEYITSVSQGGVTYNAIPLTNTTGEYDDSSYNTEYELDAEMQSVGAANLSKINMVLAPTSTVFTDAPEYIVNTLTKVVTASASLGICEPELSEADLEGSTTQSLLDQGLTQGITWFASAGDEGAYDCYSPQQGISTRRNGGGNGGSSSGGSGSASVDWPCSMPEIVCMGGTQLSGTGNWNSSGDLTAYQTETTWNEYVSEQGGAGGGGASTMYTKPTWQTASTPADGQRDVPDLALQAATYTPGVALYDDNQSGLDVVGGTSVASPLGAGIFALIANQKGCSLGDIHSTLYTLGAAQKSGGAAPFHDITTGNNTLDGVTGFSAAAGYDQATGWGSLDVATLIANWPSCTGTTTTTSSSGTTSGTSASSGTTSSSSGTTSGSSSSGGSCELGTASGIDNGDIGSDCTSSSCAAGETCEDLFGDGTSRCWATCTSTSSTCPGTSQCTELEGSSGAVYYCLPICEPSANNCPGGLACNPYTPDTNEYGYCFAACTSATDCNGTGSTTYTCSSAGACLCGQDSDCGSGYACDTTSGACYAACGSSCTSAQGCCATEGSVSYCDPFGTVVSSSSSTSASGTGTATATTATGSGTATTASGTGTATATNASGSGTGTTAAVSSTTSGSSGSHSTSGSSSGSGSGASSTTGSSSGSGSHTATTSSSSGAAAAAASGSGSSGGSTATTGGTTFSTTGGSGGGCSTAGGELSLLPLIGLVFLKRRRK